ncbi:twin-arginine translocation signal domain-containing protein [Roseateles sp. GG27B]
MISRRVLIKTAAAAGATMAFPLVQAEAAWPTAPVRVVVPFTAGGASDVLTRLLAEKLQSRLAKLL